MIISIVPRCPGGHRMTVRTARTLMGSGVVYTAWCACPCGWVSPRITSTDEALAASRAVEIAGGAMIPDDHLMDGAEVHDWVKRHIRQNCSR